MPVYEGGKSHLLNSKNDGIIKALLDERRIAGGNRTETEII